MLSATSGRAKLACVPLALLILSGPTEQATRGRRVHGHILEVFEDGSFRLEEGLRVQLSSDTAIVCGGVLCERPLLVGLEVEAEGRLASEAAELRANRVEVLTGFEGAVEGTAVLEQREDTPQGTLLHADGRRLLLSARTRIVPADPREEPAGEEKPVVEPGMFIRYRGQWTQAGLVAVDELTPWRNTLGEKEKALYRKYESSIVFPADGAGGPGLLKIDKNRYWLLDNNEIHQYVERVGERLLPALWKRTDAFGYRFWFVVAVHEQPQASAFPSGAVVIHSGLFRLAENEAQFAFVIAHEIAHVTQEHAWREYQQHRRKLLWLRWSTAGLGYVVESAIRRGYLRVLEAQADRLALGYMSQAGYDPREGLKVLRRLEQRQEGLSALLWDTHKSYGRRRALLMQELARFSQAGLRYADLSSDSREFVSFRDSLPGARVERVEVVQ